MTPGKLFRRRRILLAATALAAAGAALALFLFPRPPRARGPMPQGAYVWQRAWTDEVRAAAAHPPPGLSGLVALGAEVSFERGQCRAVRVGVDGAALRASGVPVGLALRVGPYPGPFAEADETATFLADLAASLAAEAAAAGLPLGEIQIDFDCAEAKLEGYRRWVEAIQRRVAPIPVTITALPCWLDRAAFRGLAEAADGYVLQVHSIARPELGRAESALCDPAEARAAVERAARLGRSFRVALPTYGALASFDARGRLVGLSAEGPGTAGGPGLRARELRADPAAMAGLVRGWTESRPRALAGILWYRLPVEGDVRNWPPATLEAVMTGRPPREELACAVRRPEKGLVELDLVNAGEAESQGPALVAVRCPAEARLLAADGLGGFALRGGTDGTLSLASGGAGPRLAPGERRMIAWLRFDRETEVTADVSTNEP